MAMQNIFQRYLFLRDEKSLTLLVAAQRIIKIFVAYVILDFLIGR